MRVRKDARTHGLRATLRRDWTKWLIAAFSFLPVSLISVIWFICGGDNASPLVLAMAGFGVLKADVFAEKLREAAGDQDSTQSIPDSTLLTHLEGVLRFGLMFLGARKVAVTIWDQHTGQRLNWDMDRGGESSAVTVTKPGPCLLSRRHEFCSAVYVRKGQRVMCCGVDCNDCPIGKGRLMDDLSASSNGPFQTLLLSYVHLGPRWRGTVAYIDAPVSSRPRAELRKLKQLVAIATAGGNLYQAACNSVRTEERRRLARDLHDGVTQSLIATELQIALLERESATTGSPADSVLANVREILRRETRKLRSQIRELQQGENSAPFTELIRNVIREFERETGISARFESNWKDDQVPSRLAFELTCVLKEALSNVRKHSNAKRVDIRLKVEDMIRLMVRDDGRGLGLSGRFSLAELQLMRYGPRTICERVQTNGGDLILESSPGGGLEMEISIPLAATEELKIDQHPVTQASSGNGTQRLSSRRPPQSVAAGRKGLRML